MIDRTVGGYRILEKRGEGGMGTFYKAVDLRLERIVGLKTLRPELLDQPGLLEKLQSEARALAHLDHPNIARLLHYLVEGNEHFIVMEYVNGSDLGVHVRREGLLPLEQVGRIIGQSCAAIGYAHSRPLPVIHRDIKPSNILLTDDGQVKVTDFGIAKILGVSAKTRTGMATGSLPYMAPEQIKGGDVDARTDIYQLGVTLFELLTGVRPFQGENEYEMMTMHLEQQPPRASATNGRVPEALDDVVRKAMAKPPDLRFQNAREFAEAVSGAIKGRSTPRQSLAGVDEATVFPGADAPNRRAETLRRPAKGPELPPRRRMHGARYAILGVVVIVVLVAAWFTWMKNQPAAAPTEFVMFVTTEIDNPALLEHIDRLELSVDDSMVIPQSQALTVTSGLIQAQMLVPDGSLIGVSILGLGPGGDTLVEGERSAFVDSDSARFAVVLSTTPSARKLLVAAEDRPLDGSGGESQPRSGSETKPPPVQHNLTIDIVPFDLRRRVDQVWIDGRPHGGSLPIQAAAMKGTRSIRWQIGEGLWTDTITIAEGDRRLELFYGEGRGRLSVSADIVGGAGSAKIALDGVELPYGTPVDLRDIVVGPHRIELILDGYLLDGGMHIVRVTAGRTEFHGRMIPIGADSP